MILPWYWWAVLGLALIIALVVWLLRTLDFRIATLAASLRGPGGGGS